MPATNALLQEGRYRIDNEFPHEGAGAVYDAYDTVSETRVVVREVPVKLNKVATVSQIENLNIAFADQAKMLIAIKHDSLMHVRDFFSEVGRQYLVMESVDGDDLRELLGRQKGPFPVSDVTSWAHQLLEALHCLHTNRTPIIHQNVRPENIKLNSDGKVKLTAFGLICSGDSGVHDTVSENGPEGLSIAYSPLEQIWYGLDAASQKVITNKYDESSERILKEDLDARSDIYSLGATLYHLITARPPADALERSIEILEGRSDPLRSPNKIDPAIPLEVSDVIVKAMEIKREYRFDSALIMRQVLRTALIRVQEREAEEALEQREAANEIRLAQQGKQHNVAAGLVDETEQIKAQLREAEAKRLLAEQRAAEAERKLHESEAARFALPEHRVTIANLDDDLLGLLSPSPHISEVPKILYDKTPLFDAADDVGENPAASQSKEIRDDEVTPPVDAESKGPETNTFAAAGDDTVVDGLVESPAEEAAFSDAKHVEREVESLTEEAFSENKSSGGKLNDVEPIEEKQVGATLDDNGHAEVLAIEDLLSKLNDNKAAAAEEGLPEPESSETVTQEVSVANQTARVELTSRQVRNETYTEPVERTGFASRLPAIAIAATVLVVFAIGAWMLMSSGTSEPTKTSLPETPSTSQAAPADRPVESAFQPDDAPATGEPDPPSADPVAVAPSTVHAVTAAPKQKKSTPIAAKTPVQKKAVTADDLINDN